jgi:hypothetical protein
VQPTIQYYEFLLKSLQLLKEMVQAENVPAALHPRSQIITKELLEAIVDYVAIIEREVIKLKFWEFVLDDDWARKWYYSISDPFNWDDLEDEEDDG